MAAAGWRGNLPLSSWTVPTVRSGPCVMRAHLTWLFNSSSELGFLTTFSQYLNMFIFLERDFNLLKSSELILKIDCFGVR